ncbi:hypothetical protein K469DRAFT_322235 [Zopfia rhizophila CBS 207.26]|uniref:Uncharacterized protein n=1 Tax=Zopfia rhizophila CBS 207.26 TaxID=1314779 RepID=A0A6A6DIW3_9PEZI|nr:hypothetical protein K469DRAFT_151617 [Zopfia rhizophila CBS 207.26]KAF2179095.1 hypothetical protein K469DRAFT_322235 [Zopfia rhizophila CBS 207.26]
MSDGVLALQFYPTIRFKFPKGSGEFSHLLLVSLFGIVAVNSFISELAQVCCTVQSTWGVKSRANSFFRLNPAPKLFPNPRQGVAAPRLAQMQLDRQNLENRVVEAHLYLTVSIDPALQPSRPDQSPPEPAT